MASFLYAEATTKEETEKPKRSKSDTKKLVATLTREMQKAAKMLDFELAAQLRDKIKELTGNN